jgi:hypothetical protein
MCERCSDTLEASKIFSKRIDELYMFNRTLDVSWYMTQFSKIDMFICHFLSALQFSPFPVLLLGNPQQTSFILYKVVYVHCCFIV